MSAIRPYEPASTHWDTARERDVDAQLDAEERELDSREELWEDCEDLIRRIQERFFSGRDETALRDQFAELLDRQAAITELECMTASGLAATEAPKLQTKVDELQAKLDDFEGDCYCGATVTEWYDLATRLQAEADELTDERDRLSRQAELKDGIIEGLRQSLDETIDERNALVHCLDSDCGMRASWDGLRKFWTIEATSEHMDARRALLAKLSEMECTWMPLPVDANGVPCRIGDVLDCDEGRHEVMAVSDDCVWFDTDAHEVRLTCCESRECRHVKPDTVESLLEEFHGKLWSDDEEQMAMLEEYAERIRRAVER